MKTDILFIRPACQMISIHPFRRPSIERSDWIFCSGAKNRRDEVAKRSSYVRRYGCTRIIIILIVDWCSILAMNLNFILSEKI